MFYAYSLATFCKRHRRSVMSTTGVIWDPKWFLKWYDIGQFLLYVNKRLYINVIKCTQQAYTLSAYEFWCHEIDNCVGVVSGEMIVGVGSFYYN